MALLIDVLILAYPAYLANRYRKLPAIYDITTDPIYPPRFDVLARLRTGNGSNTAVYAGLYTAEQQRKAYPDIEPISLDLPPQKAFEAALKLVTRRWLIVDERPPQPPQRIVTLSRSPHPHHGLSRRYLNPDRPRWRRFEVGYRSSSRYFSMISALMPHASVIH